MPSKCIGIALLVLGIGCQIATVHFGNAQSSDQSLDNSGLQIRLLDKCCQVGKERAIESAKFNCKLSASEALLGSTSSSSSFQSRRHNLFALSTETLLARDPNFADQCELVLESCCMAHHRTRNCNSGKQFAKSGSACMDVELSSEATVATESFNDCCMSCSLGILAARTPSQNETSSPSATVNGNRLTRLNWSASSSTALANLSYRCKLMQPLASSLSGQLYEQTYIECCQENLQRPLGALVEPGAPIDCNTANACAHRCVSGSGSSASSSNLDRCECFSGYKLASDGFSCLDVDECKLNLHTCNKQTEICDNTRGSFRCLARGTNIRHLLSSSTNNNDAEIESVSSGHAEEQQPKFASMRLCPPNNNWNAIEQRCQTIRSSNQPSSAQSLPSFTSNSHYRQSHSVASYASSSLRRRSIP